MVIIDKNNGLVLYATNCDFQETETEIGVDIQINERFVKPAFNFENNTFYETVTEEEVIEYNNQQKIKHIEFLKQMQYEELSITDWYYVRKKDTGQEVPIEIQNERDLIREKYNNLINELL